MTLQETAKLESQAYELEQQTALAAEAKTVLDSWVRYEGQVKQRQQKELAASIIAKVQKELENPKVLQQILQQSVADVESKSTNGSQSKMTSIDKLRRDCLLQGPIDGSLLESRLQGRTSTFLLLHHPLCAYINTCALANSIKTIVSLNKCPRNVILL